MRRIFAAVAMAAAALTTLSLAGPSLASAGTSSQATAAQRGKIYLDYSQGAAGYRMSGGSWRFRYIETTLNVPDSSSGTTGASIALGNQNDAISLSVRPGGGKGSVTYGISYWENEKPLALAPLAGERIKISIYYDRAAKKSHFAAVSLLTGRTATATLGGLTWTEAQVMGYGTSTFATSETRLWTFIRTRLTSYNGTRGTVFGPWNTHRVIATTTGGATAPVVLWPTYPAVDGHNFSILWRTAS